MFYLQGRRPPRSPRPHPKKFFKPTPNKNHKSKRKSSKRGWNFTKTRRTPIKKTIRSQRIRNDHQQIHKITRKKHNWGLLRGKTKGNIIIIYEWKYAPSTIKYNKRGIPRQLGNVKTVFTTTR